jgi:hypothetical protein
MVSGPGTHDALIRNASAGSFSTLPCCLTECPWAQAVNATLSRNFSAGERYCNVFRGRWLRPQNHSYDTWISGVRSGQASPSSVQLEDLAVLTLDRELQNLLALRLQVLPTRPLWFSSSNTLGRNFL